MTSPLLTGMLALLPAVALAQSELIANGSFEDPTTGGRRATPKSSLVMAPINAHWVFKVGAGVQRADEKDVHFYVPGNQAAGGAWVAYLQGENSTLSQRFISPGGPHRLRYFVAGRDQTVPGGNTRYEVRVDGVRITADSTTSHQPWTARAFDFEVGPGEHVLEFAFTYPPNVLNGRRNDETFFVDEVSVLALRGKAGPTGSLAGTPASPASAGKGNDPSAGKADPGDGPNAMAQVPSGAASGPAASADAGSGMRPRSGDAGGGPGLPAKESGFRPWMKRVLWAVLFTAVLVPVLLALASVLRRGRSG